MNKNKKTVSNGVVHVPSCFRQLLKTNPVVRSLDETFEEFDQLAGDYWVLITLKLVDFFARVGPSEPLEPSWLSVSEYPEWNCSTCVHSYNWIPGKKTSNIPSLLKPFHTTCSSIPLDWIKKKTHILGLRLCCNVIFVHNSR